MTSLNLQERAVHLRSPDPDPPGEPPRIPIKEPEDDPHTTPNAPIEDPSPRGPTRQ